MEYKVLKLPISYSNKKVDCRSLKNQSYNVYINLTDKQKLSGLLGKYLVISYYRECPTVESIYSCLVNYIKEYTNDKLNNFVWKDNKVQLNDKNIIRIKMIYDLMNLDNDFGNENISVLLDQVTFDTYMFNSKQEFIDFYKEICKYIYDILVETTNIINSFDKSEYIID